MVTVFNAMTSVLKVTPFSVKSLSEASVAVDRFKVSRGNISLMIPVGWLSLFSHLCPSAQSLFLVLEVSSVPEVAVEICKGSLGWEEGVESAQPSPWAQTQVKDRLYIHVTQSVSLRTDHMITLDGAFNFQVQR